MHIDLQGKTALVTGASRGIGLAIATGLTQAGATVVINARTKASAEAGAADITAAFTNADVRAVASDVSTPAGVATLTDAVPEVDILINNLGIYESRDPFSIPDQEWRRYFEVNVLSAVGLTQAYLPGMMSRGWGRVLSLASDAAIAVPPDMLHYAVSKTALMAAARGFAKVAAGTGVTVNSVIAGPTRTEGAMKFISDKAGEGVSWDEAQRRFMASDRSASLLRRLIEPAEIANMVVYLSSQQASATTGGAIRVDGGYVDSIVP